jgi:hypothetical protein
MSEATPETPAPEAQEAETTQEAQPEGTPQEQPESQAETDPEPAWDPERAKEKIRKINSENKALRERATKAEEKAASVDDLQQQTSALGSENLRLKVGYELGLPLNLVNRLQGSTREELVADAEALVELVSPAKPAPTPGRPVPALKPGATAEDITPAVDDSYPADFLPRRMRERASGTP